MSFWFSDLADYDVMFWVFEELPFLVEDTLRNRIGSPIGTLIADYWHLRPGKRMMKPDINLYTWEDLNEYWARASADIDFDLQRPEEAERLRKLYEHEYKDVGYKERGKW